MDDDLQDAFDLCVEARRQYENEPTDAMHSNYLECRGYFRSLVISEQRMSMARLMGHYKELSRALVDCWLNMATIDRWFRLENIESPLHKDFISTLKIPHLGNREPLCGTKTEPPPFDFGQRYSEDARRVWDNTYYFHNDHDTYEDAR